MEHSTFGTSTTKEHHLNYAQQQEHMAMPHMMPLPAETPWNLDSMPWTVATKSLDHPGEVMQFRAQNLLLQDAVQKRVQLHHKRKSDLVAPHPPKQFISEEKITAHFNGLHISSDYIQNSSDSPNASSTSDGCGLARYGKSFTNLTYHDYQITAKELEEKLKKAHRITMCEEIKKMHEEQKKASFLPHALLNRIEKPCTALVLWQRPPILEILQTNERISKENQNNAYQDESEGIDDFADNNNSCNLDMNSKFNGMDTDL